MSWPDAVNGSFELIGAVTLWANVYKLWRDKQVRGVHWGSAMFFLAWGLWNLFYYPSLDQWLSFAGGCAICSAEVAWLALAYRFRNA
jgi:hypothetical protein